jgi:hypothetical protein
MAGLEKNLELLRKHLYAGEEVQAAVLGVYETEVMGKKRTRFGILAATSHRVVFFGKKMGGYDFESFPYNAISSIEQSKGLWRYSLALFTSAGNAAKMKQINDPDVPGFVSIVRERMGKDASPAGVAGVAGVADELSKLAALRDGGLLSLSEWERATALHLGKPPTARDAAIAQLRSLHALYRDGVLSESEFNMKKWDVLARDN